MRTAPLPLLLTVVAALTVCLASQQPRRASAAENAGAKMTIKIETSAFAPGANIPAQFTCAGANVSPALKWSGVPQEAKSLALVMHDPDAPSGDFTHWLLYGMPASRTELPEHVAGSPEVAGVGRQGKNGFGKTGYGGPCPPPGKPHRYYFLLYALDADVQLPPGEERGAVEEALRAHVLAEGELMGKFGR